MKKKPLLFTAFFMGLSSALYVATPFGRIPMFDLMSYALGPILLFYNYRRFSNSERKLLFYSMLWFLGACYTNWWRGEPFDIALKGNAIVFNVSCMLVVSMVMLKYTHHVFLWFWVGAGVSTVISLYVFQNGATLWFAEGAGYAGHGGMQDYLVEKQIYPIYISALFMSVLFPLRSLGLIPWGCVIVGCIGGAFFLLFHGGSRSGFGTFLVTAAFVAGYAYSRHMIRALMKNFLFFIFISGLAGIGTFQIYTSLARTGTLGESEHQKYLTEMVESDSGALGSRDDLIRAWPFLKNHFLVGAGSSALDRWACIDDDEGLIPGHSALVASWSQNGIAGLIFWLYALYLILTFIRKKMIFFGDWFPFMANQMIVMVWNILFSPFGGYRGTVCVAIALCVVTYSKSYMNKVQADLNVRR